MAGRHLAKVAVSVTTLSPLLKNMLEPRTSTPSARLRVIRKLTESGIPVHVMAAPVIPMINDMELEKILCAAREAGVKNASYVLIRLPHEVKTLFKEWLAKHYPDRARHVMNLIKEMRGGKEYDSTYGKRMKGEGQFAELIEKRFMIACKKFKLNIEPIFEFDTVSFVKASKNTNPLQFELL